PGVPHLGQLTDDGGLPALHLADQPDNWRRRSGALGNQRFRVDRGRHCSSMNRVRLAGKRPCEAPVSPKRAGTAISRCAAPRELGLSPEEDRGNFRVCCGAVLIFARRTAKLPALLLSINRLGGDIGFACGSTRSGMSNLSLLLRRGIFRASTMARSPASSCCLPARSPAGFRLWLRPRLPLQPPLRPANLPVRPGAQT